MEVTEMLGGASGGNCATGIEGIAMRPARMMTSEQTDARIGRLMKVFTNMAEKGLTALKVQRVLEVRCVLKVLKVQRVLEVLVPRVLKVLKVQSVNRVLC